MGLVKGTSALLFILVGGLLLSGCIRNPGKIAFTSDRDGNEEIYIATPDGTQVTRLTSDPSLDFSPMWSPDHRWVAFVSQRTGNPDLFMIHENGERLIQITNTTAEETHPRWSPDGRRLVFLSQQPQGIRHIFLVSLDNLQANRLTFGGQWENHPVWSPNGRWIAFTVEDPPGVSEGLFMRNPEGVNNIRLTQGPDTDPAWSPDSEQIVFQSTREGNLDLYVLRIKEEEPQESPVRLTEDPAPDYSPTWSPNGKWIAFLSERDGNPEIYVVRSDGSRLKRLTINDVKEMDITWSRDNQLIFVSYLDGDADIFAMDPDGEDQTRLTLNTFEDIQPAW